MKVNKKKITKISGAYIHTYVCMCHSMSFICMISGSGFVFALSSLSKSN